MPLRTKKATNSAHVFSVRLLYLHLTDKKSSTKGHAAVNMSHLMEVFEELDSDFEAFALEDDSRPPAPPSYSRCASPPPAYTPRAKPRACQSSGLSLAGDMSYHRATPDLESGSFQPLYRSGRFRMQMAMSTMLLGFMAYATISGAMISWSKGDRSA